MPPTVHVAHTLRTHEHTYVYTHQNSDWIRHCSQKKKKFTRNSNAPDETLPFGDPI